MSLMVRILCLVGAAVVFLFITTNIRKKRVQIEDSLFWVLLAGALLIVAIFPQLASAIAHLFGFLSPSNLVFAAVIGILLAKMFTLSTEVSTLKHRVNELAQEEALMGKEDNA